MDVLKKNAKSLIRKARELKIRQELNNLLKEGSYLLSGTAGALLETIEGRLDDEEERVVSTIEGLRERLEASSDELSIIDYGAGTSGSSRTEEEMEHGVVVTQTIGEFCRKASKPYFWSLLLFKLVRKTRPEFGLELGTALGISGAFEASAMKLNGNGRMVTMEGADSLAELARENFKELGLDNIDVVIGRFDDTLGEVLKNNKGIDFAFIDGHHDEKATVSYFEKISSHMSSHSIIVFDDIKWSEGMRRAWSRVISSESIGYVFDLGPIGICLLDKDIRTFKGKNSVFPLDSY